MLYPLIFESIYKEMIWGGGRIAEIRGEGTPAGRIGESWDITCRAEDMGIVANGIYAGKRFLDLLNTDREKYLGTCLCKNEKFPLLVKIIDANDNLSVQVHPSDDYAGKNEKDNGACLGKTEIWYVLEVPEDGELIIGIKQGIDREQFKAALENGNVEDYLERVHVEQGDVINIPAGLTHALTKGSMVLEVQQNSDITYRVYDYGRLGADGKARALHIDKALDVIDFDGVNRSAPLQPDKTTDGACVKMHYMTGEYFDISKYDIEGSYTENSDFDRFFIFTCVNGDCEVRSDGYCMDIKKGESVFIPAALGEFSLTGNCSLIKSFVP